MGATRWPGVWTSHPPPGRVSSPVYDIRSPDRRAILDIWASGPQQTHYSKQTHQRHRVWLKATFPGSSASLRCGIPCPSWESAFTLCVHILLTWTGKRSALQSYPQCSFLTGAGPALPPAAASLTGNPDLLQEQLFHRLLWELQALPVKDLEWWLECNKYTINTGSYQSCN